jgi:ubiquinone/menaquinone biosynthesis C-methylase UbiE
MTNKPLRSVYNGQHAKLYDFFYAEKPYAKEAAFVYSCLKKYGKPAPKRILELACGTGTHALLLEKQGLNVIATDYSEDMLSEARKKARAASSKVDFRHQDMCALKLPEASFDAVICLFDSIGYVQSNENIQKVLAGVGRHLRAGGLFIFEFWHAGAMIKGYDPLRVRRWKKGNSEILRISETEIDYVKQLCHVNYSIYDLKKNAPVQLIKETHTNRFFLVQEMALFLSNAGFTPLKWFSGFEENEKIDDQSWDSIGVARFNAPFKGGS